MSIFIFTSKEDDKDELFLIIAEFLLKYCGTILNLLLDHTYFYCVLPCISCLEYSNH